MSSAFPALLRVLVAACRNDYNCKAAAKQGAAGLAAKLLSSNSTETVFESVCLLYTLTTVAETRLAVGQALVRTQCLQETPAVDQLIVLLATSDAGQYVSLQVETYMCAARAKLEPWLEKHVQEHSKFAMVNSGLF